MGMTPSFVDLPKAASQQKSRVLLLSNLLSQPGRGPTHTKCNATLNHQSAFSQALAQYEIHHPWAIGNGVVIDGMTTTDISEERRDTGKGGAWRGRSMTS